jgi:hypothetical protein
LESGFALITTAKTGFALLPGFALYALNTSHAPDTGVPLVALNSLKTCVPSQPSNALSAGLPLSALKSGMAN